MAANVAFEILYKEYYVRVFGLCRRLLNSTTLAEDATQEAFMRAYRQFDKYDMQQPFWRWIATIANNHCIDVLRKGNRSALLFGDPETELAELASEDESALVDLISEQNSEALTQAVAALPDKYRVPVVLAYFHESSYDDIATDLEITRNHVGVLLLRAKKLLRQSMDMQEIEA